VFLRDLREKHHVDDALVLVDAGGHLTPALSRTSLRFQVTRHGNRNAVERVFREIKRRTYPMFRNAEPTAAESWLRASAACWNRCLS
jgi:putative transposase